ncbi:PP2C family protein-serine/threonine phosphatase [Aureibacillus halotolerans]|uniref:Sigma-B regulation protein RsbU (Phosphoserine phosphatase) n=1 Tax=Aureibacillus halotolerans TaxID=1508390 RepID=A0A4R6TXJ0_9BACI|nr:PP2C family protein-serine/threonine phosphatase [Aureibacillus halotolerans]TDQ36719.1 sigma-B regulation protein RsbU (phosphoserine phosphatase) [Aureibacillus halotolerans]
MEMRDLVQQKYKEILIHYLQKQDEQTLYKGQELSRKAIEQRISPEEIVSLHVGVLEEIYPDVPEEIRKSFDVLLEVMIGYGFAYREHQSLRHQQLELKTEIEVAANMQTTLLQTETPNLPGVKVGAKSVPAKQMNGDYYHFAQDENDCLGVAIADVIGKGMPAALCMSMIKYSMDSLPETRMQPGAVLENLNRVVEHNVDPSMFITMLYGIYDPRIHSFFFSSAGHEPGFYYNAKENRFTEISTKGLVLGVTRTATFEEYRLDLAPGDMIVLLSDGVTECRAGDQFIEREFIAELIQKNMDKCPQEIVEGVYDELARLQEFELRDDFTLIILRRDV